MLNAVKQIVLSAGEILRNAHMSEAIQKEGHGNFATDVDLRLQQFLMEKLGKLCPEAVFIAEEKDNERLSDRLTWIVDPLDGTTNFIHDYHMSAISVALAEHGSPILGCVYNPYMNELFSAEKGKGCYLNDRRVFVTDNPMERALVAFGTSPYNAKLSVPSMNAALRFLGPAMDIRRGGSAALELAYVACGRQDIFFELTLKPWDIAAGALLVAEAGGVFDMPLLDKTDIGRPSTVYASNRVCESEGRKLLMDVLAEYGVDAAYIDAQNR